MTYRTSSYRANSIRFEIVQDFATYSVIFDGLKYHLYNRFVTNGMDLKCMFSRDGPRSSESGGTYSSFGSLGYNYKGIRVYPPPHRPHGSALYDHQTLCIAKQYSKESIPTIHAF